MGSNYNLGTAEGVIRVTYDGKGVQQGTTDLNKVESSGKKAGSSLEGAGTKMAIAGGVIAAGIGYATSKAIDFEKQISGIGAVSDASNKQLDQLRQKALQLGADTQFSASQAASAMEELAKAGVSVPDILNGAADAATALAAAGGVDLPTAATLAANAMNAFNIKATDLKGVVDTIAGAANASAIDVGQFGESLQQVGAVANLSGLSFHDTAIAIAELGNAGIKGSDAGTSLKTFLQNLIPTTKQQVALFDKLGITTKGAGNQFFDAAGKAKSLADISQVLQTATKGMSEEQKLSTLQILFGSDAIRAAAVFADQGATGFNNLGAAMDKTSAADVAAKRMNNAAGQLEQLKGSVETAGIAFGELLLPKITATAKALTQFANWVTNLSPLWKNVGISILGAVSSILLFGAAAVKIIQYVKAFQELYKAIKAIEIGTKLAAAATRIWAAAQFLLDAALSPIGLIVIAIIAVIAVIILVIKYHEQIWQWIQRVWDGFLGLITKVWDWIKSHWPLLLAILGGPFVALGVLIAKNFGNILNFFASIGKAIAGFFNAIFGPIISIVAPAFKAAFDFIIAVTRLFWSIMTAIETAAFVLLNAVLGAALAGLKLAWETFWNALVTVVRFVWGIISPFITLQLNIIRGIIQVALNIIQAIWRTTWGILSTVINAVWGPIASVVKSNIALIQGIIQIAMGIIQSVWNASWTVVKATIQTVSNIIVSIIRFLVAQIVAIFNGLTAIVNKIRGFFDQMRTAANGGAGTLIAFFAGIPGRILGALGNVGSMLYNAGRSIIQGLVNGILSMVGKVKDAVSSVLKSARNLLPFSPAKEGPFSGKGWTTYSGASIMDAFGAGILDKSADVYRAVQTALSPIQGALSDASLVATTVTQTGAATVAAQPASDGMGAPSITFLPGAITVDADGNVKLDPKKVAVAANEGNRLLSAYSGRKAS